MPYCKLVWFRLSLWRCSAPAIKQQVVGSLQPGASLCETRLKHANIAINRMMVRSGELVKVSSAP